MSTSQVLEFWGVAMASRHLHVCWGSEFQYSYLSSKCFTPRTIALTHDRVPLSTPNFMILWMRQFQSDGHVPHLGQIVNVYWGLAIYWRNDFSNRQTLVFKLLEEKLSGSYQELYTTLYLTQTLRVLLAHTAKSYFSLS